MLQKTYMPRETEIEQNWVVIDAKGKTLGRLASQVAHILRGKHKPTYSPHVDMGDHVVVINAREIQLTGRKWDQKVYYRHTGYPGGLKTRTAAQIHEQHPERLIELAVWGMLPHNRLGRRQIRKLRVYPGSEHPHVAQKPQPVEVEA